MYTVQEEPLTFLIVDSNPMGRLTVTDLLKERFRDCCVHIAQSIAQAVDAIKSGCIHCVITHALARCTADALVGILREVHATVPIVASGEAELADAVMRAGGSRFVRYGAWYSMVSVLAELLTPAASERWVRFPSPRDRSNVLVAHECWETRQAVAAHLADSGCSAATVEVSSDFDTLQVMRAHQPDLAFVDHSMAGCIAEARGAGLIRGGTEVVFVLSA